MSTLYAGGGRGAVGAGVSRLATEPASELHVVTAEDADGGLRLSVHGHFTSDCLDLRDVVLAALKSEPPRVEVDLAGLRAIDAEAAAFLLACGRLARLLGVEYRLTRVGDEAADALGQARYAGPSSAAGFSAI